MVVIIVIVFARLRDGKGCEEQYGSEVGENGLFFHGMMGFNCVAIVDGGDLHRAGARQCAG